MPPRYAYWTIIVDNQPTAFRAGLQEDLMPTFNRLKEKHPSATMMWFQNGKLWPTRVDAQEAMRARGEMGRRGDERQGGFRDRAPAAPDGERRDRRERPEWTPKAAATQSRRPAGSEKLEWKPKGEFTQAPPRSERPEWKPKSTGPQARRPARPEWKSKPGGPHAHKPSRTGRPEWKPRGKLGGGGFSPTVGDRKSRGERLDWKPKGSPSAPRTTDSGSREKRKWIPKEEYKKSKGAEVPRDSKWRPGGAHRDPRQKYKDAKKAKWTRFKETIRTRWESKPNKKRDD